MNAKRFLGLLAFILAGALTTAAVRADDTEIYMAPAAGSRSNVLIIFDNSKDMSESAVSGPTYIPSTIYPGTYTTTKLYKRTSDSTPWVATSLTLANVQAKDTAACTAYESLNTNGQWTGQLTNQGACGSSGASRWALGNFLNYNTGSASSCSTCGSQVSIVQKTVASVVDSARGNLNFGLMVFGSNQSGGRIIKKIADLSNDAAFNAFAAALPGTGSSGYGSSYVEGTGTSLNNGNGTPLSESLYDAGAYFAGVYPVIGNDTSQAPYPSPITNLCQKNYVIVITNGSSTNDCSNPVKGPLPTTTTFTSTVGATLQNTWSTADGSYANYTASGTCSGGQPNDYMDNVARFLDQNDMSNTLTGKQNVKTFTVGVFTSSDPQLQAAAAQGEGKYFNASNAAGLSAALTEILDSIILAVDSSFVAPVVPVNPENRTYSGSNIYIGLFKPQEGPFWFGNLKKYALNSNSQIVDKNGNAATIAAPSPQAGEFDPGSISYWSTDADGGYVDQGGVGALLFDRTLSTRKLYTYLGSKTALTDASNAFNKTNITPVMLFGAGSTDTTGRDKVVNFIYGYDAYNADVAKQADTREWVLGDILHSRPAIVNYSKTRAVIFVGANDGMLHAFEDNYGNVSLTDGQELWGFIPPDVFPNLNKLGAASGSHGYFVDGSPKIYLVDANNDGQIKKSDGDQAILIFGERRGGDAYYALDVTDPDNPVYLWRLLGPVSAGRLGLSADVPELGLSFSDPAIGKVNTSGTSTPAFFIGGGYDATAEDSLPPATDTKGRGVYAFKIFPDAGALTPTKIWEYSHATSVNMTYSVPSTITILDTDSNGYIDRLYVGDLGGRMWRFMVGDVNPANWTGQIIFKSNPGQDLSTGRKIFYPPDVTLQPATTQPATTVTTPSYPYGYRVLFFGTGDRERPQTSTSITDRMYAVKDVVGDSTHNSVVTEGTDTTSTHVTDTGTNLLVDVTADDLQATSSALDVVTAVINPILAKLERSAGWYIKLDQNLGEKVLAPASIFAKVASYSTYTPPVVGVVSDSCKPQLGIARIYQVDYLTGEAVFNYDTKNDAGSGGVYDGETNTHSLGGAVKDASGNVIGGNFFRRTDRVLAVGTGIPSGIVNTISELGGTKPCDAMGLMGAGGTVVVVEVKCNATRTKIYWSPRY